MLTGAVVALGALAIGRQLVEVDWTSALLGAALGFGFLLLFYVVGIMGAGDVKFAAVLGLWVGLPGLFPIWIIASLMAAVHSMLWLALKRWALFPRLARLLVGPASAAGQGRSPDRMRFIPYAAYLALAGMAWMVWGRQS